MESRNLNLDLAKIVAILFVITEHVLTEVTITFTNDVKWNLGLFIWSFIKINVPVFLIVTAHLSFSSKVNVDTFFIKKIKRIYIPVIFWSLFYYVFYGYSFDSLTVSGAIYSVLDGSSMYHLYFMYWFIGFCFFIPFIYILYERSNKGFILYFVLSVFATSLIPTINSLFSLNIKFFEVTGISKFGFLIMYAFVPLVSDIISNKNKNNILSYSYFWGSAYVISASTSFLLIIYFYYCEGVKIQSILNGGSIFVFISSFSFYNMVIRMKINNVGLLSKLLKILSPVSFGVYLIHPAILYPILLYIYRPFVSLYTDGDNTLSVSYLISCVISLYVISSIISFIVIKTKYIRKCVL